MPSQVNICGWAGQVVSPVVLVGRITLVEVHLEEPVVRVTPKVLVAAEVSVQEGQFGSYTYALSFRKLALIRSLSVTSLNASMTVDRGTKYLLLSRGPKFTWRTSWTAKDG